MTNGEIFSTIITIIIINREDEIQQAAHKLWKVTNNLTPRYQHTKQKKNYFYWATSQKVQNVFRIWTDRKG
jgi:hypothetical protein